MIDHRPLGSLSYGMYIVAAKDGEHINGQISNSVFQVASEPSIVSVSINKLNDTHDMIARSGAFAVSVLDRTTPMTLVSTFGFKHGREGDKFGRTAYRPGKNGAPIVMVSTTAYLEVAVRSSIDAATHTIFLGDVTETGCMGGTEPMTYEYYRRVLKGTTPRAAPTFSLPGQRVVME
jgi:flavin reductase (DIM6/NTAB) family NADH-FMN oxidoreductase RutF